MCPNFCILYYLKNTNLTEYRTCGHAHYKLRTGRGRNLIAYRKPKHFSITPRLQKLLMSSKTADHMA